MGKKGEKGKSWSDLRPGFGGETAAQGRSNQLSPFLRSHSLAKTDRDTHRRVREEEEGSER